MLQTIKNIFSKLFSSITIDVFKWLLWTFIPTLFFSYGGAMITHDIIGWFLIFLGLTLAIWRLTIIWNKHNSIKNKLEIFDTQISLEKGCLRFGLCLNNFSNQVIECYIDKELSTFRANDLSHNYKSDDVKSVIMKLYPFATHAIWTDGIYLDFKDIKPSTNYKVDIYCKIYLRYGKLFEKPSLLHTCLYESTLKIKFDENKQMTFTNIAKIFANPIIS